MLNKNLKQRIVGILVLVALAVIFIPVLFDFEPSRPVDTATRIPPAPDIEPVVMEKPDIPQVDNEVIPSGEFFDLQTSDEMSTPVPQSEIEPESDLKPAASAVDIEQKAEVVPQEKPAVGKAPEKPTPRLAANGLPEAWVVQVVSYPDKAKAEALSSRLQSAGFRAFVRPVNVTQGTYHRVYVGPHILKKNAEAEKVKIDSSLDVNSLIIPFEP